MSNISPKHADKDWITVENAVDRDNKICKKKKLKSYQCGIPEWQQIWSYNNKLYFTPGYIICWIGISIYYGGVGSGKSPLSFWLSMPYGIYAPQVQCFNE